MPTRPASWAARAARLPESKSAGAMIASAPRSMSTSALFAMVVVSLPPLRFSHTISYAQHAAVFIGFSDGNFNPFEDQRIVGGLFAVEVQGSADQDGI